MNSDFAATVQALCLGIITALLAFSLAVPARVEESAEQQWEYMIQSVPDLQFTNMMTHTVPRISWPCRTRITGRESGVSSRLP